MTPKTSKILKLILGQPAWVKGLALLLAALGIYGLLKGKKSADSATTFAARRGPLQISVLEGGSLEALSSQDIKCEVRGYQGVKILKIVEEGYQVTEEDVISGKILVELDSSELQKQITQQDIQFESTAASLIEAQQAYKIQIDQNKSDVKAAEQKSKFARMDFEKFMGDTASKEIVDQLGLDELLTLEETNAVTKTESLPAAGSSPAVQPEPAKAAPLLLTSNLLASGAITFGGGVELIPKGVPEQFVRDLNPLLQPQPLGNPGSQPSEAKPSKRITIDFAKYANIDRLGDGDAKQKIRKLEDDLQLAKKEHGLNKTKLESTQRLEAKGFATKTELENDEIMLENTRLKVQTTQTARELFLKYEFLKSSEEFLSKYEEAIRELDRAKKGAISKLAQAEAKQKSAEGRFNLEKKQRKDLTDQMEKCTIRSKKTGLVVYGGGNMNMNYYGQEQIREGALVREQQPIITIPDMTQMAVKVRIHETYIKKVKKGQKVNITVDAFADKKLEGEVSKVGVLPDSQNRWMNPDLKVYLTTINLSGTRDWLKPGMSAKVEILVKELPDVIYVPIQAVTPVDGKQICYVAKGIIQERREIEIGEFNDEFIEVTKGIKEGEKVCLKAPEGSEDNADKPGSEEKEGNRDKGGAVKPAPASTPPPKAKT
jgi:RND family efflux transporter MFP subunit